MLLKSGVCVAESTHLLGAHTGVGLQGQVAVSETYVRRWIRGLPAEGSLAAQLMYAKLSPRTSYTPVELSDTTSRARRAAKVSWQLSMQEIWLPQQTDLGVEEQHHCLLPGEL